MTRTWTLLAFLVGVPLGLSACLSEDDARAYGYEQGLQGEGYSRILSGHVEQHRSGWVEGNAIYCQNLSFTALARAQGALPTGICPISDQDLQSYCQLVDYAAFGNADQDLPQACTPSQAERTAFTTARAERFCTSAQGREDTRAAARGLFSYGACSPGWRVQECERSDRVLDASRPYCAGTLAYISGIESQIISAQGQAVREAADDLAELSLLETPSDDEAERLEDLEAYLQWVPNCRLRGLTLDCRVD